MREGGGACNKSVGQQGLFFYKNTFTAAPIKSHLYKSMGRFRRILLGSLGSPWWRDKNSAYYFSV